LSADTVAAATREVLIEEDKKATEASAATEERGANAENVAHHAKGLAVKKVAARVWRGYLSALAVKIK
jgi:hypothetical protein